MPKRQRPPATALEGTTDLELSSFQVYPGASAASRIVRLTVTNRGPVAALASESEPLQLRFSGLAKVPGWVVHVRSPDWSCEFSPGYEVCSSTASLAAGTTSTFELEVDLGTTPAGSASVSARIRSSLTPDPDPKNDQRGLDLNAPLSADTGASAARNSDGTR